MNVGLAATKEQEQPTDAEQPHRSHRQAHDRTTKEGSLQRVRRAMFTGSQRRTDICLGRGEHANHTRHRGAQRTEEKRQGLVGVFQYQQSAD